MMQNKNWTYRYFLVIGFLLMVMKLHAQKANISSRKVENLMAFTRLYGYVRWFHPSDEAASIDWDAFAIYGCSKVENASNDEELISILKELFSPIAPSVVIYKSEDSVAASTIPCPSGKHNITYWQHEGVGLGGEDQEGLYRSVRVNRPQLKNVKSNDRKFGPISSWIDATAYRGCEFRFSARVKMNSSILGTGHLWVMVDKKRDGKYRHGFFENMDRSPIRSTEWQEYEITGTIDSDADLMYIGFFLRNRGEMFIDNMSLEIKLADGSWKRLLIGNFDTEKPGEVPSGMFVSPYIKKQYLICADSRAAYQGALGLSIKSRNQKEFAYKNARPIFDLQPASNEIIYKQIDHHISCMVPLCLYVKDGTLPVADKNRLINLKNKIDSVQRLKNPLYLTLADVVVCWNVFQHFYVYWDVVKADWNEALRVALSESYTAKMPEDFLRVLRRLTAKAKDGHVYVYDGSKDYFPPIAWEWVEEKLIITHDLDSSLAPERGCEVKKINGIASSEFFEDKAQYISAATKGWLDERLKSETLAGRLNDSVLLEVAQTDGSTSVHWLVRTIAETDYYNLFKNKISSRKLSDSVFYVNIDVADMREIDSIMPQLVKAKAIICDMRGYPNDNNNFFRHFVNRWEKDTFFFHWFQVPEFIYPDHEKIYYTREEVSKRLFRKYIGPLKPFLSAQIIFIIGPGAISWAETYIASVQGAAIFVGQPTAGTNGDVNSFRLPGGHSVQFTGLRAYRPDGIPVHSMGFLPDIYVNKTIMGVIEGRDEFLEKALELVK
ncbi:MAG: peptidase S41 [Bacteroidia bacterium]|nr:peptidase S41 [Bacteroidia bacterium]